MIICVLFSQFNNDGDQFAPFEHKMSIKIIRNYVKLITPGVSAN